MAFELDPDPNLEGLDYLIDQHIARFGKTFDLFAVMGDPKKESKLGLLIKKALEDNKPLTDADLGIDDTPDDVYI